MKKILMSVMMIGLFGTGIQPVAASSSSMALQNVLGRIIAMIVSKQEAKDICAEEGKAPWTIRVENGEAAHVPTYGKFVSAFGEVVCGGKKNYNGYNSSTFHKNALAVLEKKKPEEVLLKEFNSFPAPAKKALCKNVEKFDKELNAALMPACGSSGGEEEDKKKDSKPKEEKPKTPEELKKLEESKEKAKQDILNKIKAK